MQSNVSGGGPESAPGGEGKAGKRSWFSRHRIAAITLSVLLAGLLAGGIFVYSAVSDPLKVLQNRRATPTPSATEAAAPTPDEGAPLPGVTAAGESLPTEEPPPEFYSKDSVNFLILGTDMNAKRLKTATTFRTDCVMLVSIDVKQKTAALISMPRDTYVKIYNEKNKRVSAGRINQVFFQYGGGFEEHGAAYAMNTVSQFLAKGKLPIDHYVLFNMDLVKNLVDAVGGVDVYVKGLRDDVVEIKNHNLTLYNNTLMHMDGHTAITYARDRHNTSGGDQGRVTHQQDVMIATLKALKDKGNIIKAMPELFTTYRDEIVTDIQGLDEIIALAWIAKDMELSSIKKYKLSGAYYSPGGASYILADQEKKQKVVLEVFGIPDTADSMWTFLYLQGQIDKVREAGQVFINSAKALLEAPGASAYPAEVKKLKNAIKKWEAAADNNDRNGMESALKDVKACHSALKAKVEATPPPTEP